MEVKIYMNPLSDKEHSDLMKDILKYPIRFHLVDVFRQMKFGRPAKTQEQIQKCIDFLELNPELGEPFSPEIVNAVWGENN